MHGLGTLRALNTGRARIKRSLEIDSPRESASYTPPRKPRKPKKPVRWSALQLGVRKAK